MAAYWERIEIALNRFFFKNCSKKRRHIKLTSFFDLKKHSENAIQKKDFHENKLNWTEKLLTI